MVVVVGGVLLKGAANVAAARRLDLDDLGTHVSQEHGTVRAGDQRCEIDDSQSVQRFHGDAPLERVGVSGALRRRRLGCV